MTDTGQPFADADPEDRWDASDPVVVLVDTVAAVLAEMVVLDRGDRDARLARVVIYLAVIRARIENGEL